MGAKLPNPVSPWRATRLCALAIFAPAYFSALEKADSALLERKPNAPEIERILVVRRALLSSLVLVLLSAGIGFALGRGIAFAGWSACSSTITALQIVGSAILLWATLAVRGWDILTYASVTLTERVNQWIYRFLYCVGTGLLVWSVAWPSVTCG